MDPKSSRSNLYLSVFILNLVYLVCGTTFAWSSPVLMKLNLTDVEGSSVASMLSLGSILGPFVSTAVLDILGRKNTVGLCMAMFTVSWFMLALGTGIIVLSIGRFIAGAGAGITASVIPLYIAEISEYLTTYSGCDYGVLAPKPVIQYNRILKLKTTKDSIRGFLNTLSQISVCLGSLLIYAIGPFVSYNILHFMMIAICAIFFIVFPLLPNSPYSLVMKNKVSLAQSTLMWLRGSKSVLAIEKELEDIQNTILQNKIEKGSMKELFTLDGSRRALLICCGLVTFQQISGISIVCFYSQKILQMTGTDISSGTCSIIFGVIMLLSAFIAPVAVKKMGYKIPLLLSILGMALGMGGLGVFFLLKSHKLEMNFLPLLSIVVYILFFNVGFANIPWALSGELFSSKIKPQATAIIASTCGVFAFLSTNLFADFIHLFGLGFVFIACSAFCCVGAMFVLLMVQDTSGLSFAEIQELLNGLNGRNRKQIQLKVPVNEDSKL